MKLDPILSKALRFARKKNYDAAIRTLEVEANRYYGSFTYYYILGLAYLHSKIFGVALTYLRLAAEQKMRDPNTLLALAALYLNHGDTDKAIDLYLEVQSLDATNKIAKAALKTIKKHPGPEDISVWIDSGKLHTLFPPFPKADIPRKELIRAALGAAAAICIVFGIVVLARVLTPNREERPLPVGITLEQAELDNPLQLGGSHRFVLTRSQVLDEFAEAQRLFIAHRDEAARVRLNRILESNASEPVKNRARLLIEYMETPGFDTLIDRFSYSEVIREPFLFRGCHVIWRGMATNIDIGHNHTSFDFLVGFDTRRILEGIVHVHFDFAIPINPEHPVEILGRVIPVSGERDTGIMLEGIALHQAALLERAR